MRPKGCQAEFVEQLLQSGGAGVSIGLGDLEHRQDVLLDRHAAKDRGFLRQIAEAQDRAAIHRQAGNLRAVEVDPPAVGLHQPHDRIETGGLARPVRPEQPDHFAALDVQRHVVQHGAAVIGLGDRPHVQTAHLRRGWTRHGPRFEGMKFVHSRQAYWPPRFGTVK